PEESASERGHHTFAAGEIGGEYSCQGAADCGDHGQYQETVGQAGELTENELCCLMTVVSVAPSNYSEEKLQQVILYFLEHINNVHLGRTKLMKLLYFVDFDHFEAHGASVTGATYRKLPHGPYPDKIEKVIAKMETAGLLR